MKCRICDKTLSADEVQFSELHQDFEPCTPCLMAIAEVFKEGDEEEMTEVPPEEMYDEFP